MYRKILVPLDGSSLAKAALPYAVELAGVTNGEIILLRAALAHTFPGADASEAQIAAVAEAEEYLAPLAQELRDRGLGVQSCVYYGEAAEAIIEEADFRQADLIAMSTHGRSGLSRLVLGSVATQVMRRARVPVLLVRPKDHEAPAHGSLRRMLVPLDGTAAAEAALPHAGMLAQAMGLELALLKVLPSATWAPVEESPEPLFRGLRAWQQQRATERAEAQAYVENIARLLWRKGLRVETALEEGLAADRIVAYAEANGIDLVAMATHGRSAVGRLFLGSVADEVMRSGVAPVLLVRATVGPPSGAPALAGHEEGRG